MDHAASFQEMLARDHSGGDGLDAETAARPPGPVRGHVKTWFPATEDQAGLVERSTAEMSAPTRRFLCHLLASTYGALRHDDGPLHLRGFVPVSAKLIERNFRGADVFALETAGLISVRSHSRVRVRSRSFRVDPDFWRSFVDAGLARAADVGAPRVDLMTRKTTTRRLKSKLSGPDRNPWPPLVRAAMEAVGPATVNADAVEEHLRALHADAIAPGDGDRDGDGDGTGAPGYADSLAWRRYLNDVNCYQAVLNQRAEVLGSGLVRYQPAYGVQKAGRLSQLGGGLQSCSRAMKAAAYSGLDDVFNYDLRGSQARLLILLMREAGIAPDWLLRYGNHEAGKHVAAGYVGISVDAWKSCLYAILMAARVPNRGQVRYSSGAVKTAIMEDVGAARFDEVYGRFYRLVSGLKAELGAWHDYLLTDYVAAHGKRNNADGKTYIRNAVGMPRAIDGLLASKSAHEAKASLAAFVLQGREAAFVHALAGSSSDFGFRVWSHEHDGLVVQGKIPDEAIQHAADAARIPMALVDFELKAFV